MSYNKVRNHVCWCQIQFLSVLLQLGMLSWAIYFPMLHFLISSCSGEWNAFISSFERTNSEQKIQCEKRSLWDYRQNWLLLLRGTKGLWWNLKGDLGQDVQGIRNTNRAQCGDIRTSSSELYRSWEKGNKSRLGKWVPSSLSSFHKYWGPLVPCL